MVLAILLTGCTPTPTTPPLPNDDPGVSSSGDAVTPISKAYSWPTAVPETASLTPSQCLHEVSGRGTTGISNKRVAFDFASLIAAGSTGSPVELGTLRVTVEDTGDSYSGVVTETSRANNALILKGTLSAPQGAPFTVVLLTEGIDTAPNGFVFSFRAGGRDLAYGSVKPIDSGAMRLDLCGGAL